MPDAGSWALPDIDWGPPLDEAGTSQPSRPGTEPLVTWPPTEFETTATDCFRQGDQIWIWQPLVGAVRFSLCEPRLFAFPWPGGDVAWFREVVTRSWLPAIYPLWGRQVLHASAVICTATGATVAFTGPTHAGKSTTAFGLSRRPGWRALGDDTLAFSVGDDRSIPLHPIPNEARLRPESAGFYGLTGEDASRTLVWPGGNPRLSAVYVLEGDDALVATAAFERLRAADSLPLLLQQAYALSFGLPKYNQQLMKDYLALSAAVPIFRLRYRRSFEVAEELFSAIAGHLATEAGVTCATPGDVAADLNVT